MKVTSTNGYNGYIWALSDSCSSLLDIERSYEYIEPDYVDYWIGHGEETFTLTAKAIGWCDFTIANVRIGELTVFDATERLMIIIPVEV